MGLSDEKVEKKLDKFIVLDPLFTPIHRRTFQEGDRRSGTAEETWKQARKINSLFWWSGIIKLSRTNLLQS